MLPKVVLNPNGSMVDGKRPFNAVSPGAILATFIQEGKARGALAGLSYDFSTTHDSAGDPWSKTLTLAIEPGKDLLAVLINLGEQGVINWRMQGRTLQAYNPDTVLGADKASGSSPVDLRLGRDIIEAPDTGTLEDAVSAILIGGEGGLSVEVTNPSAVVPWGRWEAYQSQNGVSDSGTATLLGQNALERVGQERVQVTRGLLFNLARWLPFADYQPGDYLLAPGDAGEMQSLRLRQITLSVDADGQLGGNVVLNDRFLEREIRLARQAAGILDGGVSSGGSGGEPAPETQDRVPAAPLGLIVEPAAYLDEHGYARRAGHGDVERRHAGRERRRSRHRRIRGVRPSQPGGRAVAVGRADRVRRHHGDGVAAGGRLGVRVEGAGDLGRGEGRLLWPGGGARPRRRDAAAGADRSEACDAAGRDPRRVGRARRRRGVDAVRLRAVADLDGRPADAGWRGRGGLPRCCGLDRRAWPAVRRGPRVPVHRS
ncbi:hypothetical protein [Nonomuraea sp. B19D2]|uniref:hypothetical protein n=1 Tax=Nonomuraea sp. B19D2 TaxID=3159561 RepID=UPI0032DBDA0B